ncbi:MAG: hypothetical protein OEY93_02075 [Anaerolineae bacterium]|nr:hypothetical protein [Anaerolineae bacterium]
MRTIRASEVGAFLYCRRAWRYRLEGIEPSNQADLTAGIENHHRHNLNAAAAGCMQSAAFAFMLAAVVLAAVHFTLEVL